VGCHQDLSVGELLLPFALLGPMALEHDIDLPINVREGSATGPILLWRLFLYSWFSLWWGRWQWPEWSIEVDCVLEVPTITQGVAHLLVVRALGVEDLVQCLYSTSWHVAGLSCRGPSDLHFVSRSPVRAHVRLLISLLRCLRCNFMWPMRSYAHLSVVK
jgi:hypothetical protein